MENAFNILEKADNAKSQNKSEEKTNEDTNTLKSFEGTDIMFSEIHLCNSAYRLQPFFEKLVAQEIKNIEKREFNGNDYRLLQSIKNELILRLYSEKKSKRFDDNDGTEILLFDLVRTDEAYVAEEEFELFSEYFCDKHNLDRNNFQASLKKQSIFMQKEIAIMNSINEFAQCTDFFPYSVMHMICMNDASKLNQQRARLMQQAKNDFVVDYSKIELPTQRVLKK